jgi:hypothetical protein
MWRASRLMGHSLHTSVRHWASRSLTCHRSTTAPGVRASTRAAGGLRAGPAAGCSAGAGGFVRVRMCPLASRGGEPRQRCYQQCYKGFIAELITSVPLRAALVLRGLRPRHLVLARDECGLARVLERSPSPIVSPRPPQLMSLCVSEASRRASADGTRAAGGGVSRGEEDPRLGAHGHAASLRHILAPCRAPACHTPGKNGPSPAARAGAHRARGWFSGLGYARSASRATGRTPDTARILRATATRADG